MRHLLKKMVLFLSVIALLVAIGCDCLEGNYFGATGDTDKLEIIDHYLLADFSANAVVHFTARNISDQRIDEAIVEVIYYDGNEEIIGSKEVTVSDIRPGGETALIRATSSVKRSEVNGYGFNISVELLGEE